MKKLSLILISCLLAGGAVLFVQAEEQGKRDVSMEKLCMERMSMGKLKEEVVTMGRHKMTGSVDNVDHAHGTLMLKTAVADMALHFPPSSIKNLKNGDTITVEMSFMKGEPS